jgi:hypothetical protein
MRKLLLVVSLLMVLSATPALAVTDGTEDGNGHPQVGLMVALDGSGAPLWRCSGTLLSSKVFLTAGHCTESPAARATIWFDADVESGIPANGYPTSGQVSGTTYTHPDYNPNAFFVRDVGVVVLDTPVTGVTYASLPALNSLDKYKNRRGKNRLRFDSVGYGLQMAFPDAAAWKENNVRVRMIAHPRLIQMNVPGFTGNFSLLLSNNTNTGGTCFGDSGGPNFIKDSLVVAGVTSFGLNSTCGGTGGVFRMDRAWSHDWVAGFLN